MEFVTDFCNNKQVDHKKIKLGIFTDPHYCDQDVTCRTRRPVLSYGKIREAMETFVREKVDFVLCLGDILWYSQIAFVV